MKIANKITLSFLSLAIVLSVASSTIFYIIARNDLQNEIDTNLESIVHARSQHIQTYLATLKIAVGQLSKSVVLEDFLENRTDKNAFLTVEKRLRRTKEANPYVYEFLLLDKTGRVIASTDEASIGEDRSSDLIFLGGQRGPYIKDAYYSDVLKEPLIAVSVPFLDSETQELIGVLAARIKLEELYKILTDRAMLGDTGEVYIVNKYGYMITPSRFLKNTFLKQKVDTRNFRESTLQRNQNYNPALEQKILICPDYRGIDVLGAHAYVPEMQWSVLAEVDLKEAFGPLIKIHFLFLLILFAVPLISYLLGFFLSRLITEPIHKLHKGTEVIGAGDLDYKVGTPANDEIGQLSRAFDQMTEDLRKSRDELKAWGLTLENRVQGRTEELNRINEATLNILEDLTEAKTKLEEALKIKSDFTSMVSHELRTPLAAIKEGIAIVADHTAGSLNEKQKDFLGIAQRNVDRLTRIIGEILDFQKLEAGKMVFNIEETDINHIVKEVEGAIDPLLKNKGLNLTLKLQDNLPLVSIDKDKIAQVLINLVDNAIKATEKGGITITTGLGDNFVSVQIKDTGCGIKEEDIPKLFQRFVQLEHGTTRKPGGTGLGLNICKQVIDAHRGKIWVESNYGQGSTFQFILPVKERREQDLIAAIKKTL